MYPIKIIVMFNVNRNFEMLNREIPKNYYYYEYYLLFLW